MHTKHMYANAIAGGNDHQERKFHSGFIPSLSELASRPVQYTYVTEYKGSVSDNVGKTDYHYDYYAGAKNILPNGHGDAHNKWHVSLYKYWETPVLVNQTDYKTVKDGNGSITGYDEKRKITNNYNSTELYAVNALHVQRNYIFPEGKLQVGPLQKYVEEWFFSYTIPTLPAYAYGPYSISVGTKNLTSTTETLTNDDDSTVSTFTSYVYNANNYVSEVHTETSKTQGTSLENLVQKKEMTYPFDYPGIAVLDTMVVYNMLQHKVEEKDYFNGQLTNSTKINYKDWMSLGGVVILPDTLLNAKSNGALEPKVIYHKYDTQGNPQEIYKVDAPHTYYIWGYDKTQPIAKIDNFTSGEASGIQALIDSAVAASDVDNDNCKDVNCKEQELRDALALIQNNSALDNAQMSYFTYDPLIGATSMTDPRGITVYYVYDAFNRLKEVRDADGNLVSDYDYSYKQPVSN